MAAGSPALAVTAFARPKIASRRWARDSTNTCRSRSIPDRLLALAAKLAAQ